MDAALTTQSKTLAVPPARNTSAVVDAIAPGHGGGRQPVVVEGNADAVEVPK